MANNLTRIQNNQITDSTIQAQAKLAAGSITGNLLASTVTFNSNITILGNLTVANSYTQLNSINTYINDPVVVFNNNYVGSLTNYDIGILVNRNLASLGAYGSVNTFLGWSESAQAFIAVATTETGTAVSSINNSGYANVSIGNLTAVSASINNNLTAGGITNTPISGSTGYFTTAYALNFSTANAVISGGSITNDAISSSTAYLTTAQANNFSTGNALITGGSISGITNLNVTTETATNFASGNAVITGGSLNNTPVGATTAASGAFTSLTASSNIVATSGTASTNTTTGAVVVVGGVGTSGNIYSGGNHTAGLGLYSIGAFNGGYTDGVVVDYVTNNGRISVGSGDALTFYTGGPAGTQTAQLSSTGVLTVAGNIVAASGTASSSTTTGALVVSGGTGISGAVYAGSVYDSGNRVLSTSTGSGNLAISGTAVTLALTGPGAVTTGSTTAIPVITTDAYGRVASISTAALNTSFTLNGTSGTASVANGSTLSLAGTYGVTVTVGTEYANIATPQDLRTTSSPTFAGLTSTANVVAAATTVSTNTTTGALVVAGGAGIAGDVNIGGNLKVSGTLTYINTTTELVGGVEIVAGNLVANSGTASTNVSTGALVVVGGAGISGAVYAGSIQNTPIGSTTASTGAFTTVTASGNIVAASQTPSTTTTTGALVISGTGGLGVGGNINAGVFNTSLHNIKGNVLFGQGSVVASADSALTINLNTDTPIVSNATIHVSALTGKQAIFGADTFGTGVNSVFSGRHARGTSTTPTAVQSGDGIVSFSGRGYGTTGYSFNIPSPGLYVYAGENFTDAAQGAGVNLQYTPIGANTAIAGLQLTPASGNVTINSFTPSISPTTGALVIAGGIGVGANVNIAQGINAGLATFASINSTPIGNATPSTGAFSTLTATTSTLTNFSTANALITGGSLTGITIEGVTTLAATNFSTANAQITGGSINGTIIGNATPAGAAFTTLTTSGLAVFNANLVANSNTPSFAPTAGAIVIAGTGGLGVGGNINVGQTLFVGTSHLTYSPQNAGIQFGGSQNSFSQVVNQNASTGNNASTDFAAVANNGSDNDTYIDMGITGSGYSQAGYNLYGANDGYLIVAGNTTTGGGNLILNTYNANDIIFATGGTTKQFEVARITSGNTFVIKSTINPTPAANVGSLQNWGSSSTTGNAYIGGATVLNGSNGAGNDVIVKGANTNSLIWARPSATYDQVLIGNSATTSTLVRGAKLQINSTDSMLLPAGTNAQRPSSTGGTDVQGMFRYSTTAQGVEWYTGSQWVAATTSFTVIADAQFSGTGSQTIFTLATAQTTASCIVSINGVVQIPSLAYSVSGTTLTFTEAPASTDIIDVRMLTTTATVTQISSTNGYMQFLVDNNGAYVTTGAASATVTTTFLPSGAQLNTTPNVTIATTGNTAVDSFYANTYSSAEYTITGTISGTNIREISKLLLVTDGTNVYRTVYGVTSTSGNTLTSFSANIYNGSATLWAAPANANTIYRIRTAYQAV